MSWGTGNISLGRYSLSERELAKLFHKECGDRSSFLNWGAVFLTQTDQARKSKAASQNLALEKGEEKRKADPAGAETCRPEAAAS